MSKNAKHPCCADCADHVAGTCMSSDENTKKFFEACQPGEMNDCDRHREAEERPQEEDAETLEENIKYCLSRIEESSAWPEEDTDPDQRLIKRADDAAKAFKGGPSHAIETACEFLTSAGMDAREILHKLLKKCPELEGAKGQKYRLTWRLSKWAKKGRSVFGSSGPITDKNREQFSVEESWQITLSLTKWLLLDEQGRERLIHHELMHVVTADHAVQEFPETVQRYGCHHKQQVEMVIAAITRDDFMLSVEKWGLGKGDQVLLPWGGGEATVEVKIRVKVGGTIPPESEEERLRRVQVARIEGRVL
jgi:hypothetical protein